MGRHSFILQSQIPYQQHKPVKYYQLLTLKRKMEKAKQLMELKKKLMIIFHILIFFKDILPPMTVLYVPLLIRVKSLSEPIFSF